MRQLVLLAAALVAFVAAPTGAQAQRGRCTPERVDSVHTRNGPVYRDCDVNRKATTRYADRFDPDVMNEPCVIAEVEFVVDTTGRVDTTSTFVVIESNNAEFLDAMKTYVRTVEYRPAEKGGALVRQVVRYRRGFVGLNTVRRETRVAPANSLPAEVRDPSNSQRVTRNGGHVSRCRG